MTPERKAAERIYDFLLLDTSGKSKGAERVAAIIAKELTPMRAMMERMVNIITPNQALHGTCGCSDCVKGRKVLADYAAMKAEWEADYEDRREN